MESRSQEYPMAGGLVVEVRKEFVDEGGEMYFSEYLTLEAI